MDTQSLVKKLQKNELLKRLPNGDFVVVDLRRPPRVRVLQTGAIYPIEFIRPKENPLSVVVRKDGTLVRYDVKYLELATP